MQLQEQYPFEKLMKVITTPTILDVCAEKFGYTNDETTINNNKYLINSLKKIASNLDNDGRISVSYKKSNTGNMGRYFTEGLSLQKMFRPIRQYLTHEDYVDIDMVNSQPSIILGICERLGLRTPYLREYVNNRNEIFKALIEECEMEKWQIKNLFIILLNGGSYNKWMKENDIKKPNPLISNLTNELKKVRRDIIKEYGHIAKFSSKNTELSKFALITQHIENEIVMQLHRHLSMLDIIRNNNCSLQFDGLQVLKNVNIPDAIDSFNELIKSEHPYVKFIVKPYDNVPTDEDFQKAQDLLSKKLYYFDHKNLHNYLYGFKNIRNVMVRNRLVVSTTITMSDYSKKLLMNWYKNNIIKIDNDSSSYYIVFNKKFNEIEKRFMEEWTAAKKDLSCDNMIQGFILTDDEITNTKSIESNACIPVSEKNSYDKLYEFLRKMNSNYINIMSTENFIPFYNNKLPEYTTFFNRFMGFSLDTEEYEYEEKESFVDTPLYNHIKEVTCDNDEEVFKYLIRWIAQLIQYPEIKHRVSLVQYGIQGTGKDTLCDFIASLLGKRYFYRAKKIDEFLKAFNSLNCGKLCVVFNEVEERSSKKNHDILKHVIDTKEEMIERKFLPPVITSCYKRFIFNTNNKNSFNVETTNSRLFMLHTSAKRAGDFEYFANLKKLIDDRKYMKLAFNYFSTLDLSDFNVFVFPKTDYEREQKAKNMTSPFNFIQDIFEEELYDSYHTIEHNTKDGKEEKNDKEEETIIEIEYNKVDFYSLYTHYCSDSGYKAFCKKSFWAELESYLTIKNTTSKCRSDKKKSRYIYLTKEEAQNIIKKHLKL